MRILFLTQVLPYPLDAGPKTRAYYVLRYLAQKHDVVLVSFVRQTDTQEAIGHLGQHCSDVRVIPMPRSRSQDAAHLVRSLVTSRPFIIQRDRVRAMNVELATVIADQGPFDAVHSDQLWMAPYALTAAEMGDTLQRPLTVLDQHNAVYLIPERLAEGEGNPAKRALLAIEARKMARFEVETCARFDRVAWVTEEDFEAVDERAIEAGTRAPKSAVIPICTDPAMEAPVDRRADSRRVTFLGGLHYPPNAQGMLWFAENVFPLVLAQAPDAVLTVIGKQPPAGLHKLGFDTRNLDVTGYAPDPKPYLAETAAFIVPLHSGGGMRVKILDAWTWGVPIVSTTIGAEGIGVSPGEDILIGDSAEAFAEMTIELLRDPHRAEQIARAGRLALESHYDWRNRYQEWDEVYA